MNDKYQRVKQFTQKHRLLIAYGVGIVVGGAGTYKLMSIQNPSELFLAASPDNLQKLIDGADGALKWTHGRLTVYVLNDTNPVA